MKAIERKNRLIALMAACMFIMLAVFGAGAQAASKYKTWEAVVDDIDLVLDEALEAYKAGDTDTAYKKVNSGYFDYYEVTGMERVTLGYIGGARKGQVEMAFSNAKSVARKGGSYDDFAEKVEKLRGMLREDAQKLDGTWKGESGSSYIYSTDLKAGANSLLETMKDYRKVLTGEAGDDVMTTRDDVATQMDMMASLMDSYSEQITGISGELRANYDDIENLDLETLDKMIAMMEDYDSSIVEGEAAANDVAASAASPWRSFTYSFGIILREGVEAILVVGAIIAYLVKSGNKDRLKHVYLGSLLAIVASFVMAWILNKLKAVAASSTAMSQEIIEGVTALIAVCVLFYVSNWMVSKSESAVWNRYIDSKVTSSVAKGSMFALGFTAFLAVFREGAEVILFLQPEIASGNGNYIWAGLAVGFVCLAVIYIMIRYLSIKLPLKPFFLGTSILMFIMSISFLGNGIKELIEGNVLLSTPILENVIPMDNEILSVLGVYPIRETLIPQLILLAITIDTFIIQIRRNNRAKAEMAQKAK